ncbi:MAG: acetyl-CoA decarbonylase/synthase complex subunit gamma [Clostridiales bacterium]|jgi:acetyl-CoA decarbonylase/synthase complex subunit gamma|nr:acetyl-CoA decarbonylase/synthase complex subunit gamma [Clostridiales bacterium]
MALSGLKINKLLPGTNCKECGANTCMAFAMKLAAQKAMLSECPYASEEAKQILGAASEPPVKGVKIGTEKVSSLGEETVFYRHEKTFVNKSVIAINVNDSDDLDIVEKIGAYTLIRVGEELHIDAIAVTQKGDDDRFAAVSKKIYEKTSLPLILRASALSGLDKASAAIAGSKSLLSGITAADAEAAQQIAKRDGQVLGVTADDLDGLYALTSQLKAGGFNDLVIEFKTYSTSEAFQTNSIARKAALKNSVKPLGYASLRFIDTGNALEDFIAAVTEIDKYGGILVLPSFDPAQLVTLMTLRQNIYTDPQKPIQVEPKLYPIGEPDRNSPVFVTTNFSLTYFLVAGEIENSGISAWLLIPECEGMSVLTSWAAGKFSGGYIAKFAKELDLESLVDARTFIIPGFIAPESGELEEGMPGWKVLVGPQESADIESFVKSVLVKA